MSLRIVVLASGGLDSSVLMVLLKKRNHDLLPLFVDYGQLARKKEWKAIRDVCNYLKLTPTKMDISDFGKIIPSGITKHEADIIRDAFLPTRNLLLLTVGAAFGYTNSAYVVAIGLLSNPIFPDQSEEFIKLAEKVISKSLGANIRVLAPFINLDKVDIINFARKNELPSNLTYSCHEGKDKPCGNCISCRELLDAQTRIKSQNP